MLVIFIVTMRDTEYSVKLLNLIRPSLAFVRHDVAWDRNAGTFSGFLDAICTIAQSHARRSRGREKEGRREAGDSRRCTKRLNSRSMLHFSSRRGSWLAEEALRASRLCRMSQ